METSIVPATTPCALCNITGFVRWEVVIKGGRVHREFYCGRCNRSWREDLTHAVGREREEKPESKA